MMMDDPLPDPGASPHWCEVEIVALPIIGSAHPWLCSPVVRAGTSAVLYTVCLTAS